VGGQRIDATKDCYEINIAPANDTFPTGGLVKRQRAKSSDYRPGWRELEVTLHDDRLQVLLDGDEVLQYSDSNAPGRGYIGLERDRGRVEFRSFKLKPLGMRALFNGQDLSGWTAPEDSKSHFTAAADGVLNAVSGPGQLETTDQFGDFVLQLECKVNATGANSGIFFRCIPAATWMGYESQIHNGYTGGDRTAPVDHGTGGIFRRQQARYVVADDFQWFSKTLIADGAHMAAWVNGFQVSDWIDTRAADPNPRRGSRLDAGTIIIQGHDASTDFSFRNIRIATIKER
jgi:hypothetical protein